MQAPRFVRPPTESAQQALAAGLRAADALTQRRSQIVRASARGAHTPALARALGGRDQTVRNAIRAVDARGAAALTAGSSRPQAVHPAFDAAAAARLRAMLPRSSARRRFPGQLDLPPPRPAARAGAVRAPIERARQVLARRRGVSRERRGQGRQLSERFPQVEDEVRLVVTRLSFRRAAPPRRGWHN